ncbi:MAG: laccase domain-containing protein [Myxococcales bacterium]|nr:MAG: laccase domain-containing protein [Myxococcales bacterium]
MAGKYESERSDPHRPFGALGVTAGFGDRRTAPPAWTRVARVRQVHGAGIVEARQALVADSTEADAIVVAEEGVLAAVKTADCVPVLLLAAGDGPRFAAAVHAGWRGTVAGIVARAVERAGEMGVDPERLHARLGPSIDPCCYEVGEEVAARFDEERLPVHRDGPRPRLDLRAINSILLVRAGVRSDRILLSGPCTRCCHDVYWSYRQDPGAAGRQLSWIGWADRGA